MMVQQSIKYSHIWQKRLRILEDTTSLSTNLSRPITIFAPIVYTV